MMGLTPKQGQLLALLRDHSQRTGIMPSCQEMCDRLGLNSKSGAVRLLNGLEERGHIRRIPGRARAIEIIQINELARFSTSELQAELDRRARRA